MAVAPTGDQFGISVAVSGDLVVVGAYAEDSNATGVNGDQVNGSANASGAAYVFTRSGTTWTQQAYLKASNTGGSYNLGGDYFGWSVAVSGETVVVGAHQEDSKSTGVNGNQEDNSVLNAGAAYIFAGFGPFILTPLEQWRQLNFGTPFNGGETADSFDFDRDGLVNLMEWAVGTPPGQPNPYQPVLVQNGGSLEFTYARSLAAFDSGTGYAVEWSETLATGSWQTTGVTQNVLSTIGDVQMVQATVPAGAGRRYLHLRVTPP